MDPDIGYGALDSGAMEDLRNERNCWFFKCILCVKEIDISLARDLKLLCHIHKPPVNI